MSFGQERKDNMSSRGIIVSLSTDLGPGELNFPPLQGVRGSSPAQRAAWSQTQEG